jgi:hypothetical protein
MWSRMDTEHHRDIFDETHQRHFSVLCSDGLSAFLGFALSVQLALLGGANPLRQWRRRNEFRKDRHRGTLSRLLASPISTRRQGHLASSTEFRERHVGNRELFCGTLNSSSTTRGRTALLGSDPTRGGDPRAASYRTCQQWNRSAVSRRLSRRARCVPGRNRRGAVREWHAVW